jgi:citrate lyase subunit beta/citryl-CoA lyase
MSGARQSVDPRPRRSVLYMPAANARAMEKARELPCDTLIFDLEDAVAPDQKAAARQQLAAALEAGGYGHRERIVRVNVDGVLLPKIETPEQVHACAERVGALLPIWVMIETPRGVLGTERIVAASGRVRVLVMGTSDLVTELRARHTEAREPLLPALAHCVLVARAYDRIVLDGVHLDFRNLESFERACRQGRDLGFDGKTLIHPSQIDIANRTFGPSADDIALAQQIVSAWRDAQQAGKGVVVVNGKLVENLHAIEAERTLAFADALRQRGDGL